MRAIIAIIVLLVILGGTNSITGNVISEVVDEAPGFFEKIWNFFKGLFGGEEEEEKEDNVSTIARVAVGILPSKVFCSEESRNAEACVEIYQPVCAEVRVECIVEPCDNTKETYANSCYACQNDRVDSYVVGEC